MPGCEAAGCREKAGWGLVTEQTLEHFHGRWCLHHKPTNIPEDQLRSRSTWERRVKEGKDIYEVTTGHCTVERCKSRAVWGEQKDQIPGQRFHGQWCTNHKPMDKNNAELVNYKTWMRHRDNKGMVGTVRMR